MSECERVWKSDRAQQELELAHQLALPTVQEEAMQPRVVVACVCPASPAEREFFIGNLLVRVHLIIEMI